MPANGWLNFYKWVGGVEHTKAATDDKPKWKVLGLWDALFDRNSKRGDNANGLTTHNRERTSAGQKISTIIF